MNNFSVIFPTNGSNPYYRNNTKVDLYVDVYFLECWIYSISVLFGLPVNSYVIWLIVTGTGNGLAAEFFSLNLSICEILLCLYSLIYLCRYKFQLPPIVWTTLSGAAMIGRPLFQSLICVERYLAVVHPLTFLKYRPLRNRMACCAITWLATFAASLVNFTTLRFYLFDFYFFFMLALPVLFLSIQLFCLVAVLRALKQSGPGERRREEESHMKKRAFFLILITTVTMVFIYVPYIILSVISGFLRGSNDLTYAIAYACYDVPGLVLPILFLHRVRKLCFKCH